MKTFTASRPGPVLLVLDLDHGAITVTVEDREHAEITLTPLRPGDETAAELIEGSTAEQHGQSWIITVPTAPGTDHHSVHGNVVVNQVFGTVTSTMIGISTSHSGQIIMGSPGDTTVSGGPVRAEIRLPQGSSVQADTVTANLSTTGEVDLLRFRSTSGSLSAAAAAEVHAVTMSGEVTAWQTSTARVKTMSGAIQLASTKFASASTMSGAIRLTLAGGRAKADSTSGTVTVHATAPSTVDISTMTGDVRLSAEDGASLRGNTSTVTGRITRNL
ncbi:DUF4097 family beta strand repeat-containing protein [Crossiella sp. SN42]|uniref:DUF4097 family beta strand repeat-containing protein n=1 Tax=Crossiella sp. SN42 TaxID=2944808 RepID=UPI00207C4F70|nr:DUF4097 family beta strand repeat-containing protein [Crossiella sp. SN42]MCO1581221.1 DUF4097 family beta strand repeat-containing protein [Crossiella sp. SN42]